MLVYIMNIDTKTNECVNESRCSSNRASFPWLFRHERFRCITSVPSRFSRSSERTRDPVDPDRLSPFLDRVFLYNMGPEESRHDPSRESSPIRSTAFQIVRFDRFDLRRGRKRTRTRLAQRMHLPIEKYLFSRPRFVFLFFFIFAFRAKNRRRDTTEATLLVFAKTLRSVHRASFLSTTFATLFSSRSLNLSTIRSQTVISFFFLSILPLAGWKRSLYVSFHSLVYFQNTTS